MSYMLRLIVLLLLAAMMRGQSEATLTQPPLIETNTYTLRKTASNISSPTTNITYMQNYTNAPQVFVSIVSLFSFTPASLVTFNIAVPTVSLTQFTIEYLISCFALGVACTFSQIVIDYLAFDFNSYTFVQILEESFLIDPAALINDQYYKVNYMQRLTQGNSYSLSCMLSGFTGMAITGQPSLYISVHQNSRRSYYLEVKFQNATLLSFDYIRVLIDQTMMAAASTGPSSLSCRIGTIYHYSDPKAVERNPSPDFLPFAVFFGVSGFGGWEISLTSLVYIFNNTSPRIQANVGYILFLTSSCPSNQLYVTSENLCYSLSSAFYYQATPATMQPCPYSCYQCVGPLTTQCRSCVQGWNRVLSGGRCLCISGFYDPGGPQCKNCTEAIAGCKTCSSATNCLTCLSGCTAIGFSPIYCDCPNNVQTNFSYNCPSSYYFDYTINACACLPQTYYNSAARLCFPCAAGCYLCAKNDSYCLACIDSYNLVNNTCLYFYISYALLGQNSNYNDPKLRCLRWDQSTGSCIQRCKYYFYQGNCYSKCPLGTFNISFPWPTCQPCQKSCNYCFNYTICYQCTSTYFYFNTSILSCSPCTPHCVKCANASACTLCETYYQLTNGNATCSLPVIPKGSCDDNCTYCLISHQCLLCEMPYFLNITSQACIACLESYGLKMQADGCREVCGDGKIINDQCDDGNMNTGDGCSKNCKVEDGFQCRQVGGISRCWGRSIAMNWQMFAVFGSNSVILSLHSSFPLSSTLMALHCGFKSTLAQRATVNGREDLTISYQQSVLLMALQSNDSSTVSYYSGNITKNLCQITFNQMQNVTFPVNVDPTLFFIDYSSTFESVNNGKGLKMLNKFSVYFTMATMILGVSPMTSYASSRFLILFLVSFTEYMHIPINAFSPFQALQLMLFVAPSTTTRQLVTFSSEYYVAVLWHLVVIYAFSAVWLELIAPFVLKVSKNMEWVLLSRVVSVICENKQIAYQNMYISYEVAILCFLVRIYANIDQASSILIFLVSFHLLFIVISKLHFFFTFDHLSKNYPHFTHSMVVEQFQNICIAFVSLGTTSKNSFTPIVMILFAVYPLLSLSRNSPSPPKEDSFHITVQMSIWQMRVSYVCQIVVQALKLAFMWSGHLLTGQEQYESVGVNIGLCLGLLISGTMLAGTVNSLLVHLIRVCEAKNQGRATIPSHENLDVQTVDASSHAD